MERQPADLATHTGQGTSPSGGDGPPDLGIPGADRSPTPSPDRHDELPERLGERLENGSSSGMATGEPDVLPDVDVPEETM